MSLGLVGVLGVGLAKFKLRGALKNQSLISL